MTPLALITAGLLYAYWDIGRKLVHDWGANENYSHGFLIVPIAAFLAWERRGRLSAAPLAPTAWGLAVVALGIGTLAAGVLGAELFLARVSLMIVVSGAVLFLGGWQHLRILAFPIGFLILMIPIPMILFNQIAFPLQILASQIGEGVLQTSGIPVLRQGNIITLANTTLEVAEACSGIRSLVSLLTLSVVYGYFSEDRTWARSVIVACTVPIAVLTNGLRVAGIGVAAYYYGPGVAEGFFHSASGWLVFVLAFVLMLAVQRALALTRRRRTLPAGAPAAAPHAV